MCSCAFREVGFARFNMQSVLSQHLQHLAMNSFCLNFFYSQKKSIAKILYRGIVIYLTYSIYKIYYDTLMNGLHAVMYEIGNIL